MLLFGNFNYGKKGILDMTHRRLFTFKSLKRLLKQSGYIILKTEGIPIPFALIFGNNWFSKTLSFTNRIFILINKPLFAYQIFIRARFIPTVENTLKETIG